MCTSIEAIQQPPPPRITVAKGFTLAEVLITLGIIGIVAALTMPNLINNYQKKQTVVKLRKVYSDLNNAIKLSESENGEMSTWQYPPAATNTFADIEPFIKKYYLPYFKGAKLYEKSKFMKNYYVYDLTGKQMMASREGLIVLSDGTILSIFSNILAGYTWLFADLNGTKGPNVMGKDVFVFDVYRYGKLGQYRISFWGHGEKTLLTNSEYGCSKEKTNAWTYKGFNCGALIEKDKWEIKDYYPW